MITQAEYDQCYPHLTPTVIDPPSLLLIVTCEKCGHRHRLERKRTTAETVYIVCHGCEAILHAEYQPT